MFYNENIRNILKNILENECIEIEEQCCFSECGICMERVFLLKHILENKIEKRRSTELIFPDLEKSYDSVPRILLRKIFKMSVINENFIICIKVLSFRKQCAVILGNKLSKSFFFFRF